jgi:very-short-patch-repair endonuclease
MSPTSFLNKISLKSRRQILRKNSTDAERKLWARLRNKQVFGQKFYRQFSVGQYILDFYCSVCRLAIELDGGQHTKTKQKLYDDKRTQFLKSNNIHVIRFWDDDVLNNIDGILKEIIKHLTPPTLPLK